MTNQEPQLEFSPILESDIPALTRIMTRAFDDDTRKHLGKEKGGPPGYDDGGFFRTWLFGQDATAGYKAALGGVAVAGIIVWIFKHGRNILGTIFVDPDRQDRGIGAAMWRFIEQTYPETKSWALETPGWATKNHHFYEKKCGFGKTGVKPDRGPDGEAWEMFTYKKIVLKAR